MKTMKTKLLVFAMFLFGIATAPAGNDYDPVKVKCPGCGNSARLKPVSVWTERQYSTDRMMENKTLTFKCAREKCGKQFAKPAKTKIVKQKAK